MCTLLSQRAMSKAIFGKTHYDDLSRLAVFKGRVPFDQAPEILWADEGDVIQWFCKDINKLRNADARK